jgi:hypothetical protein
LGYVLDAVTPVFKVGVIMIAIYRALWFGVDCYALYLWNRYHAEYNEKKCPSDIAQWVGVFAVVGFFAIVSTPGGRSHGGTGTDWQ